MGGANSWRQAQDGADWMREIEKRLLHEERRPSVRTAADLLGPGLSSFSVWINDWNAPETAFNGLFHSEPGAINSPNVGNYWMGLNQATSAGYGIQRVMQYTGGDVETIPNDVYVRRFYTTPGSQRQFSTWQLIEGDGGGGGTDPSDPINEFLGIEIGASQDLNGYTVPGSYVQTQTSEAQNGQNYPIALAGFLEVHSNGASMVWQRYRAYSHVSYPQFTYQRSQYNGVWSAWVFMGPDQALPDPVDAYVGGDQNITSTSRNTETPTAVRASIKNPHLVRQMLVRCLQTCWVALESGAGGAFYFDSGITSGGALAVPAVGWRSDNIMGSYPLYMAATSEMHIWVNPGATLVTYVGAARSTSSLTTTIRYTHNSLIPIRYGG